MKMLQISKPIDFGKTQQEFGFYEEIAFAIATSIVPQIQNWISKKESKMKELTSSEESLNSFMKKKDGLVKEINNNKNQIENEKPKLLILESELEQVLDKPWKWFRWLFMIFFGKTWKSEYDFVKNKKQEVESKINSLESNLSNLNGQLGDTDRKIQKLDVSIHSVKTEVDELKNLPKFINGIRKLDYPLIPLKIQEGEIDARRNKNIPTTHIFLDTYSKPKKITLPQIDIDDEQIDNLQIMIERIKDTKVLLDTNGEVDEFGSWDSLYGVEKDIKDLIDTLKEFIKQYYPREFEIPIVQKNTAIGNFIEISLKKFSGNTLQDFSIDAKTKQFIDNFLPVADEIEKILKANKAKGGKIDDQIQSIKNDFETNFKEKETNRSISQNLIKDFLEEANKQSKLTRYHYFCPKCNATAPYLKAVCGLNDEDIEQCLTVKIAEGLRSFQKKCFEDKRGQRISKEDKKQIQESWEEAIAELEAQERELREELEIISIDGSNEKTKKLHRRNEKRIKSIYSRIVRSLLKSPYKRWKNIDYRAIDLDLPEISKQLELMNENTRMIYSTIIEDHPWKCSLCGVNYSWSDATLGAVNKISYDLVYPMIHSLWNDEAIWSKKVDLIERIGREIRDRAQEETTALQSPIDQFLADSRQIRGQLNQAFIKGEATTQRLKDIASQFETLGLLDRENLEKVLQSSQQSENKIKEVDTQILKMDEKENKMQAVPAQALIERQAPIPPEKKLIEQDSERRLLAHFYESTIEVIKVNK